MQHHVIKFVSDFRQVGGVLSGTPVSSTSKTGRYDITGSIVECGAKRHNPNPQT